MHNSPVEAAQHRIIGLSRLTVRRSCPMRLFGLLVVFVFAALQLAAAQPVLDWSYSHAALNQAFTLGPVRIAVDATGNVHILSYQTYDGLALLSADGDQTFDGNLALSDGSYYGAALGVDKSGNTIALQTVHLSSGVSGIRVTKFDPGGGPSYDTTWSPDPSDQRMAVQPTCLALAPDGTAYASGSVQPGGERFSDVFVVAIDPGGKIKWSQIWDGPLHEQDIPVAMKYNDNGVVIAVQSDIDETTTRGHLAALRYSETGDLMWATVQQSAYSREKTTALAVAPNGDVFIGGNANTGQCIVKLRHDGSSQFFTWSMDGTTVTAIAVDEDENIYAVGNKGNLTFIQKWSAIGDPLWKKTFATESEYHNDGAKDVQVDSAGDVYVLAAGFLHGSGVTPNEGASYVLKFTSDGTPMWPESGATFYRGAFKVLPNQSLDVIGNLVLDGAGGFYCEGMDQSDAWIGRFKEMTIPFSVSFDQPAFGPAAQSIGTVRISTPAPKGGLKIALKSDNPALAIKEREVTIPEGKGTADFDITTINNSSAAIKATVTATANNHAVTTSADVLPSSDAEFLSQIVPEAMDSGIQYVVTLKYKNTGRSIWTTQNGFRLEAVDKTGDDTWKVKGIKLTNGPVAPGQTGIFALFITAPASPDTYNFQWQPYQDSIGFFGTASPAVSVAVTAH